MAQMYKEEIQRLTVQQETAKKAAQEPEGRESSSADLGFKPLFALS